MTSLPNESLAKEVLLLHSQYARQPLLLFEVSLKADEEKGQDLIMQSLATGQAFSWNDIIRCDIPVV